MIQTNTDKNYRLVTILNIPDFHQVLLYLREGNIFHDMTLHVIIDKDMKAWLEKTKEWKKLKDKLNWDTGILL